jgi:hypothetical protein
VAVVEHAEATEGGVDQPQPVASPGQLVGLNLAGEVGGTGQEAGIVATGRLDPGGKLGSGAEEPDLGAGADGDAVRLDDQAHGPLEVVERQRQLTLGDPDRDHLAGLVRGHEQRNPQLGQQRGQRARVLVPDFASGRRFGRIGWCDARICPLAQPFDFNHCHKTPPCVSELR